MYIYICKISKLKYFTKLFNPLLHSACGLGATFGQKFDFKIRRDGQNNFL